MRPAAVLSVLPPIAAAVLAAACAAASSGPAPLSMPAAEAPKPLSPPATAAPAPMPAPSASSPPRARYVCDGGAGFEVTFAADAAQVTLLPGGERLVLPQQLSGSGYRYATPRHELRGKGDDATWTVGRAVPQTCRATRLAP